MDIDEKMSEKDQFLASYAFTLGWDREEVIRDRRKSQLEMLSRANSKIARINEMIEGNQKRFFIVISANAFALTVALLGLSWWSVINCVVLAISVEMAYRLIMRAEVALAEHQQHVEELKNSIAMLDEQIVEARRIAQSLKKDT